MMIATEGKRWVGVVLFAVFVSLFVCWKLVVIFIVSSIPNCFDDPDLHWSETCCMLNVEFVHIFSCPDPYLQLQSIFIASSI